MEVENVNANQVNALTVEVGEVNFGPEVLNAKVPVPRQQTREKSMGISVQQKEGGIWLVQITGVLKKSELDEVRALAAKKLGLFGRAKLLLVAKDFEGWERGADWSDLSFWWHGWQIKKIAIVADPGWKDKFLAFTAAELRRAPVKFFVTGQTEEALAWLKETRADSRKPAGKPADGSPLGIPKDE